MDFKYQEKVMGEMIKNKNLVKNKEKWIKILDSNFITRFIFKNEINILDLEIMQIELKSIGRGVEGLIDLKKKEKK